MKKIFFITALILSLNSYAQITTKENANSSTLPAYVNTGNPTQDAKNYDHAKKQWISEHEAEYKSMNHTITDTLSEKKEDNTNTQPVKVLVTKAQYYLMDESTQKEVTDHPEKFDLYQFDARDEDQSKCKVLKSSLENFPVEKRDFILAHPELYILVTE